MKPKAIFIGTSENIERVYGNENIKKFSEKAEILPGFYTADILRDGNGHEELSDVEYVFSTWGMAQLSEDEIRTLLPRLKAVFYAAGTVQYFARPFLNCGVKIFSAWAANAVPVAEYTVSQIILANKGFFRSAPLASIGRRDEAASEFNNFRGNYGASVGLIGIGMIGSLVAEMLKTYDIEVKGFDPFLSDEKAEMLGVKKVPLEEIFSTCSVVSNHLANNEQTQGMLNGGLFEKMQPYATFINTGRGAQVVESELIETLKRRPDITAILDVTFPEPPEKDSEFFTLPNCILTPHIAGSSGDEVKRMAAYMYEEFEKHLNGEPVKYEVTSKMLETMA